MRYLNEHDIDLEFCDAKVFEGSGLTCPYCKISLAVWPSDDNTSLAVDDPAICLCCGTVYTLALESGSFWLNPSPHQKLTLTAHAELQKHFDFDWDDEEEPDTMDFH